MQVWPFIHVCACGVDGASAVIAESPFFHRVRGGILFGSVFAKPEFMGHKWLAAGSDLVEVRGRSTDTKRLSIVIY